MSSDQQHIDFNKISDYFNGKLSAEEMHAMEMQAQSDPFLYEAMEGFEAHPEGLDRVGQLKKNQLSSSRSFFGSRTLSIIGVAALVYVVALIIKPDITEPEVAIVDTDTTTYQEVEVVPESIDTFQLAEEEEQITVQEIVDSRPLIEESNEKLAEILEENNDVINIDEDFDQDEDHTLEPEANHEGRLIYAPHVYQFELYVVDYREIERENAVINYTKYELSGISAEFEDEDAMNNQYEREVQAEIPYMDYLRTSMKYFSRGQFKRALNRYITILEQYPTDLNAHFYGALCYYDLRQYDKALELFENLQKYESKEGYIAFRQEAKWYQAKTLLKLNRKSEAIKILEEIIAEGLFYAQDAMKLKATL